MIYGIVKEQHLSLRAKAVADTIDYLTATFSFISPDWEGLVVYAHFTKGNETHSVQLEDGKITESDHLNLSKGEWSVYLHGNEYKNGEVLKRITTNIETFIVEPTGTLDGDPFPEVEASVVEQIEAELSDHEERIAENEGKLADHEERIADNEGDIADHEQRIESLEESGAGNYEALSNLPKINGKTVIGDKDNYDLDIIIELSDGTEYGLKYSAYDINDMFRAGQMMTIKGNPVTFVQQVGAPQNYRIYFNRWSGSKLNFAYYNAQFSAIVGEFTSDGVPSDVNFTMNSFDKLSGIEAGAEKNKVNDVQDENGDSLVEDGVATIPGVDLSGYATKNDLKVVDVFEANITNGIKTYYNGTTLYSMWADGANIYVDDIPLLTIFFDSTSNAYVMHLLNTKTRAIQTYVETSTRANWSRSVELNYSSTDSISQNNSSVVKSSAIYTALQGKQNKLTAGQNITITNDVISASGGSSLPVATADKDVIYWDNTNQTYVAGAITNVISNGDNLSY